jgi:hypothetical protein
MADDRETEAIIRIPAFKPAREQSQQPLKWSKPTRAQRGLVPIALRIPKNVDLMRRFRAVIGSEDKERASKMIDEVRSFAQGLDASVTHPEGARTVVVLMKMVGYPEDDAR